MLVHSDSQLAPCKLKASSHVGAGLIADDQLRQNLHSGSQPRYKLLMLCFLKAPAKMFDKSFSRFLCGLTFLITLVLAMLIICSDSTCTKS